MRFAIVSDIHGNLHALEAVLAAIDRLGVGLTVNAGDILSGPLQPGATADRLMALDLPTIAGNHERQLLDCACAPGGESDAFAFAHTTDAQRAWIAGLPATRELAPDVLLCHGTPDSDLVYLLEAVTPQGLRLDCDEAIGARLGTVRHTLVICGHSHLPRCYRGRAGITVVNPGSVGLQAYADEHPVPHWVENGSPHARFAVCERTPQGWSVQQHAVAYDWNAAADIARRNGRPDWSAWLISGRAATA